MSSLPSPSAPTISASFASPTTSTLINASSNTDNNNNNNQFESLILSSLRLMPLYDGHHLKQLFSSDVDEIKISSTTTVCSPLRFVEKYLHLTRLLDWTPIHVVKYFQLCLFGRAQQWYEQKFGDGDIKLNGFNSDTTNQIQQQILLLQPSDIMAATLLWSDITQQFIAAFDPKKNYQLLKEFYEYKQKDNEHDDDDDHKLAVEDEDIESFLLYLNSLIETIEPGLPESAKVAITMLKLKPSIYQQLTTVPGQYPVSYVDLTRKVTLLMTIENSNKQKKKNGLSMMNNKNVQQKLNKEEKETEEESLVRSMETMKLKIIPTNKHKKNRRNKFKLYKPSVNEFSSTNNNCSPTTNVATTTTSVNTINRGDNFANLNDKKNKKDSNYIEKRQNKKKNRIQHNIEKKFLG